jgi:hypothetical protein
MEWFRFEPRTLRAPEFALAPEKSQIAWFRLLNYCAEQENGGIIAGAADWTDSQFVTICGVRLGAVKAAGRLLTFREKDLHVWGYPIESASALDGARERASAAAKTRWDNERARKAAAAAGGNAPASASHDAPAMRPHGSHDAAAMQIEQSRAEQKKQREQTEGAPDGAGASAAAVPANTPPPITPAEIYGAYPRKVNRPAAFRAIEKALAAGVPAATLLERTQSYAAAVAGWPAAFRFTREGRDVVPHPATWFNAEGYADDEETWQPGLRSEKIAGGGGAAGAAFDPNTPHAHTGGLVAAAPV